MSMRNPAAEPRSSQSHFSGTLRGPARMTPKQIETAQRMRGEGRSVREIAGSSGRPEIDGRAWVQG
jgi:hypothetical protein